MLEALRKLLTGWFGPPAETQAHAPEPENPKISRSTPKIDANHSEIDEQTPPSPLAGEGLGERGEVPHPIPCDENLLERARTQWQFGDWESLTKIDRAKLA